MSPIQLMKAKHYRERPLSRLGAYVLTKSEVYSNLRTTSAEVFDVRSEADEKETDS